MNLIHAINEYTIRLNIFEGPLDLLLHLIKKEKIDIYDIPIALITEQYLEYLRIMKVLNLDVASDFLLMASYLIYLKSRTLLNGGLNRDDEEDIEESKNILARRIIEYQTYKKGADILDHYLTENNKIIPSPGIPSPQDDSILEVDLLDLLKVYYNIIKEQTSYTSEPKHSIIVDPIIIQNEMSRILSVVRVKKRIFFRLLLKNLEKSHYIVNFLATLELVKRRKIKIFQGQNFGEIVIKACM